MTAPRSATFFAAFAALGLATAAGHAWAQDAGATSNAPASDMASPGIPSGAAVDPAPGAPGAFMGQGAQGFHDLDGRIAAMQGKAAALPIGQRRAALKALSAAKSEEKMQMARHGGELRDWDREHIDAKLNALQARYPALGG